MTTASTRSILTGVLAASLLLAAPAAAGAAESAHISIKTPYEGEEIPSSIADLKRTAAVGANVPIYSEPATGGASFDRRLPGLMADSAGSRIRISESFTVRGDQWVAIQVPESAYGTDTAKSNLADPGVAYMRAASARDIQGLGDAAAESYPRSRSDLVATATTASSVEVYKEPTTSSQMVGMTDKWGESLKASTVFTYGGEPWVAVEVSESLVPGGVAYITGDSRFVIAMKAKATAPAAETTQATPTATATAAATPTPTPAAAVPTLEPTPSAAAKTSPVRLAAEEPDVFAAVVSKIPAVLFTAFVMAGTLFMAGTLSILKRPTN